MARAPVEPSRCKMVLLSFCKNIHSSIGSQREHIQDDDQKEIILNVYLEKCSSLLQEINSLEENSLSFVVLADLLQKIAQLLLDLTYVEECCLVDQDFLLQSAYERVTNIIETLSSIERVALEAAPGNHPRDVLSPGIVECIHWRKGALLYMYCHTLNTQCSRDQLPSHFQKCLEDGSKHLICMLSTRSSPQWLKEGRILGGDGGGSAGDDGELLLNQGIYSDTHLLALMYLGEMCYWYAQLVQGMPTHPSSPTGVGSQEPGATSPSFHRAGLVTKDLHGQKSIGVHPETAGAERTSDKNNTESLRDSTMEERGGQTGQTGARLMQGESRDMMRTGRLCLENYVRAAKGPMKAGGWNTNRAEEILNYFDGLKIE